MPDLRSTPARAIAAVLLLASALLGIALIPVHELWLDESHSAYVASLPLRQLAAAVVGDVHPPLYFLALHAWVKALGDSPTALRSFSLVCMLAGTALLGQAARREDGERAGTAALALMALSPAILVYAVEIRMYALALLAFCLTLLLLRRTMSTRRPADAVLTSFASAAAIYTHYVAFFAVAGLLGAWMVLDLRAHRPIRAWATTCAVCALLTIPWVPTIAAQRERKGVQTELSATANRDSAALAYQSVHGGRPPARARAIVFAQDVASVLGVYPARSAALLALLAIPVVLLGLLVVRTALAGDEWLAILLSSGAVTLVGAWVLGVSGRRYILFLVPLAALAIARVSGAHAATARRPTTIVATTFVCGLLLAGTVRLLCLPRPTPVADLIIFLHAAAGPRDHLLFHAPYGQVLFDYYARRAGLNVSRSGFPSTTTVWWASQPFKGWGSPVPRHRDVDSTVAAIRRRSPTSPDLWLILFESSHYDPAGLVLRRLVSEGKQLQEWQSPDSQWRAVHLRFASESSEAKPPERSAPRSGQ